MPGAAAAPETGMPGLRFAIVGGGVAGGTAAYLLARRGHRVTVYDMSRGYVKPCGEVVPAWLVEHATRLGLPKPPTLGTISTYVFYVRGGGVRRLVFNEPVWASIDKKRWVEELRAAAPLRVSPVRSLEDLLNHYDVVVDARGPFASRGHRIVVWRAYAEPPGNYGGEAIVVLEPGRLGFAWLFPHGDKVNLGGGFLGDPRPKERSVKLLGEALQALGLGGLRGSWGDSYSLVTAFPRIDLGSPRAPRVGEAAGLIMSLGGEGIRPAMLSAAALARAYSTGDNITAAWRRYAKLVSGLATESKINSFMLMLAAAAPSAATEALMKAGLGFYRAWLSGHLGIRAAIEPLASIYVGKHAPEEREGLDASNGRGQRERGNPGHESRA